MARETCLLSFNLLRDAQIFWKRRVQGRISLANDCERLCKVFCSPEKVVDVELVLAEIVQLVEGGGCHAAM